MTRRLLAPLCLAAALFGSAAAAPARAPARLEVTTDPSGFDAWGNARYLGRTPVAVDLPAGSTMLELARPADSLYHAPAADTLLNLAEGETLRVRIPIGRPVAVLSRPFGLPVLRGGVLAGRTPLDLTILPGDTTRWTLASPGGAVDVPLDTLLSRGSWTWRGTAVPPAETSPGRPLWRRVGRYGMPVLAVGLMAAGTVVEGSADRSYRRYLSTAEPGAIPRYYDEARRRDAWAAALWIGAETAVVSAVVAWILPGSDERRPARGSR